MYSSEATHQHSTVQTYTNLIVNKYNINTQHFAENPAY